METSSLSQGSKEGARGAPLGQGPACWDEGSSWDMLALWAKDYNAGERYPSSPTKVCTGGSP